MSREECVFDCFVSDPVQLDFQSSVFPHWLKGMTVAEACEQRQASIFAEYDLDSVNSKSRLERLADCIDRDVDDQYRTFVQLEQYLRHPLLFKWNYCPFQFAKSVQKAMLEMYYSLDAAFLRELAGQKLSTTLRKSMPELSASTRIPLVACYRQFDNIRRISRSRGVGTGIGGANAGVLTAAASGSGASSGAASSVAPLASGDATDQSLFVASYVASSATATASAAAAAAQAAAEEADAVAAAAAAQAAATITILPAAVTDQKTGTASAAASATGAAAATAVTSPGSNTALPPLPMALPSLPTLNFSAIRTPTTLTSGSSTMSGGGLVTPSASLAAGLSQPNTTTAAAAASAAASASASTASATPGVTPILDIPITKQFSISHQLAMQYTRIIFLCHYRFETKKKLAFCNYADFDSFAQIMLREWAAPNYADEMDAALLDDFRSLKDKMTSKIVDEYGGLVMNSLRATMTGGVGGSGASDSKKLNRIGGKNSGLLRSLVAAGSLLGKHKASRNFFVELAEEVVRVALKIDITYADFDAWLTAAVTVWPTLPSLNSTAKPAGTGGGARSALAAAFSFGGSGGGSGGAGSASGGTAATAAATAAREKEERANRALLSLWSRFIGVVKYICCVLFARMSQAELALAADKKQNK